MTRAIVLGIVLACGAVGLTRAAAQDEPKVVRIQSLNVSDNLYLLSGGGGNSLALTTDTGVILIDSKLSGWGPPILTALEGITDQPVTMIINTHAHSDHTGSNAEFAGMVEIVAHERTKAILEKMDAFAGANARALPNRVFSDRLSLLEGIDRMELYYFGPGHTGGDAVVVFPEKRVAHMGDLFPARTPPYVDRASGGSALAYPDTLAKAVAALDGVARVVTGHAPPPPGSPVRGLTTIKDLEEYAGFTREMVAAARKAFEAGQPADAAAAAVQASGRYQGYDFARAAQFIEGVFGELRQ